MMGKLAVIFLVIATIAMGAGVWYAQEYRFYDEIDPQSAAASLQATTAVGSETLTITGFQGIDADSSPIRWRACAQLDRIPADLIPYDSATPLNAPGWFDCFRAAQIGADLESGAAQAFLGQSDIHPDVDRIFAIYPDGRIFGWHQFNDKNPERGVMD